MRSLRRPRPIVIPITVVRPGADEEALVLQVLRSGMLAQGPMVERFEGCCREMTGAAHAVAVNNGTSALTVAIEALGLGPGDEVITSPFTFVATLNAIIESGATVRFADIDAADFNMDPATLSTLVSPRTRVVMPVHLYGQSAPMDRIAPVADAAGAMIIEDAAQAHGAAIGGRPVGTYGMATFSFYATKNLQCGEGGVVTTNDAELAGRIRLLRNQGMRARYQYEVPGHNYRMTDLAAAVAIPQFARLPEIVAARATNAARYSEAFEGIEGLVSPRTCAGRVHAWHQYTLRILPTAKLGRDAFVEALGGFGIGAGIYYPRLVYDYDCFRGHPLVKVGDEPVAREVVTQVVSLPVHQHLSESEVDEVIDAVRSLLT
jgi:perosamine synthetase